jgi:antitoxin ParD1/3/4
MEPAAMATMNVSLPEPMKAWVEAQTQTGRYSNASDYVRDLIRRDQEQADRRAALQCYLDEAEASGISLRSVKEIVAEARATAKARGVTE